MFEEPCLLCKGRTYHYLSEPINEVLLVVFDPVSEAHGVECLRKCIKLVFDEFDAGKGHPLANDTHVFQDKSFDHFCIYISSLSKAATLYI